MKSKLEKLKKALQFISGLVTILKLLPLGSWRSVLIALSTALGVAITAIEKCDANHPTSGQPSTSQPPKVPSPTLIATPIHTPTASPTPLPVEIIVPEKIVAQEPFVARVTAPFTYNVNLSVDRFHLCILGQEYRTGLMSCTVTLWTAGNRTLKVTLPSGVVIEKKITVRTRP